VMEGENNMLAPPVVSHLRAQAAGSNMERSLSADIREEREDLREAAEQTLNVIMDLSLDGTIRWVSPRGRMLSVRHSSQYKESQLWTSWLATTRRSSQKWSNQ